MTDVVYVIVLFHSTQAAIQAERALLAAGVDMKLIPTPRQFSASCGTAIRAAWGDAGSIKKTLTDAGVEIAGAHKLTVRQQ